MFSFFSLVMFLFLRLTGSTQLYWSSAWWDPCAGISPHLSQIPPCVTQSWTQYLFSCALLLTGSPFALQELLSPLPDSRVAILFLPARTPAWVWLMAVASQHVFGRDVLDQHGCILWLTTSEVWELGGEERTAQFPLPPLDSRKRQGTRERDGKDAQNYRIIRVGKDL